MNILEVPEDIGIKNIKKFHSELGGLISNESEKIILDFSNVKRVDLSLVQILLALGQKFNGKEDKIILRSTSEGVKKQLKLAGIE